MANLSDLYVHIRGDMTQLSRTLDRAKAKVSGFSAHTETEMAATQGSFAMTAASIALIPAAIAYAQIRIGAWAASAASAAQTTRKEFRDTFGSMSADADLWAAKYTSVTKLSIDDTRRMMAKWFAEFRKKGATESKAMAGVLSRLAQERDKFDQSDFGTIGRQVSASFQVLAQDIGNALLPALKSLGEAFVRVVDVYKQIPETIRVWFIQQLMYTFFGLAKVLMAVANAVQLWMDRMKQVYGVLQKIVPLLQTIDPFEGMNRHADETIKKVKEIKASFSGISDLWKRTQVRVASVSDISGAPRGGGFLGSSLVGAGASGLGNTGNAIVSKLDQLISATQHQTTTLEQLGLAP